MKLRARARILEQLGEQLIKNEGIALLELVKNSYDACATQCDVVLEDPESPDSSRITITDNGIGMDDEILESVWLEIGTNWKLEQKKNKRFECPSRTPLGEKGIGRFGVHRLGKKIDLYTKMKGKPEFHLSIDWTNIDNVDYVDDIDVKIESSSQKMVLGESGTCIRIERLKSDWVRGRARECAKAIASLNSPFRTVDSFSASFVVSNTDWLDGLPNFEDIMGFRLFSFDVVIEGGTVTSFQYDFIPWRDLTKIQPRSVAFGAGDPRSKVIRGRKPDSTIDLREFGVKRAEFKGIIFDNDAKLLKLATKSPSVLKTFLRENGGVRVYKDGMRVMDYGDPGNDWLDLDGRRVNIPTKRFSNNLVIGGVFLNSDDIMVPDSEQARDKFLIEKANREGFVENDAYDALRDAVIFAISKVESERSIDKEKIRTFYGATGKAAPVTSALEELKNEVEEKVTDPLLRKEILTRISRVAKEYEELTGTLIQSAGAGLNLAVVIHQIEKIIAEVMAGLKRKAGLEFFEGRVIALSELVEGYSLLVRKEPKKMRPIGPIVDRALKNSQFRFESHGIKLVKAFDPLSQSKCYCSESFVVNSLMNLLDNSIWWLGYSGKNDPEIYVNCFDAGAERLVILVADNGPGFTRTPDELVMPFVSDKPNGMGIGLHLTKQIMENQKGDLIFPEPKDFPIPVSFQSGAIAALSFRKNQNDNV